MTRSSNYWDERAIRRLNEAEKTSDIYIERIKKIYDQAYKDVEKELVSIYKNYAKDVGLDVQKLKEKLTKSQTNIFYKSLTKLGLNKYVKNNYKSRISRLEQIQAQIYAKAKLIYPKEELEQTMCYKGVVNDSYYKAIYDTQMGTGYDFNFNKIDNKITQSLLNERWSGKNYSERIWGNTDILADSLSEVIGGALLSGQSIEKTSKQIRDRFNVSKHYSERLVRTETNHFNNEADAMAYEDMGIDKYVFVATLDSRTSLICQEMDNKVFNYKDRVEGDNFPPLHPNCRSKTRGYLGADDEKLLKRRARNPITGKSEIIDNMSYKEWYNKNVTQYGKEDINKAYKMVKNKAIDKEQYTRYINVIGRKNIGSLDNFKNIKYNNESEYKLLKYDYKLRNEALHNPTNVVNNITIPKEKYTNYLFNPNNEKGIIKGNLITDVLGYDINNYTELDKLLKSNISNYPCRYKNNNRYGEKYEVNMVLNGLKNRRAKVTVGLIKSNNEPIKLTTLYINKLKDSELEYDN